MTEPILQNRNIVCFGSEKWGYTGFQQHTMRSLSAHNRVLFVNPIGSRRAAPRLADLGVYAAKLRNVFAGSRQASDSVTICNPQIIPLVYNPIAQRINRRLLGRQMSRLLRHLKFHPYLLWIGTPTAAFALDLFKPLLTIYNPVDRYHAFSFVDSERILGYGRHIAAQSDLVICTSDAIRNDFVAVNPHTVVVSHGVPFEAFHGALSDPLSPEDLRDITTPVIGFFGGIHEWVDIDLIRDVAQRYPSCTVVLVGSSSRDLSALTSLPNVRWLGTKPFAQIPHYLKRFSVCLIPFAINDLMKAVDPTKLREYLTQGKPVVSVNLPEIAKLKDLVYVADNREEFPLLVGRALAEANPALVEKRIAVARESDWARRVAEVSRLVEDAITRRPPDRAGDVVPS